MLKKNKMEQVLELFYNEPTKHWHFEEIRKKTKIGKATASHWLNQLKKEGIIVHHKPKGKMPFFKAKLCESFYEKKKIYGLRKLIDDGIVKDLAESNAKTVVIFGSFSRGDWHSKSDVDIFILGESSLTNGWDDRVNRELQIHIFKDRKELSRIQNRFLYNVINGYFIRGRVQDLVEVKT